MILDLVKRTDSIQSRRKVSSLSDRSDTSEPGAQSGGEESPGILRYSPILKEKKTKNTLFFKEMNFSAMINPLNHLVILMKLEMIQENIYRGLEHL